MRGIVNFRSIEAVADFYRGLLGSVCDDGGFNYWLRLFRTAHSYGGAAVNAQVGTISNAFANNAVSEGLCLPEA